MSEQSEMRNPFRSEADAFRILVIIVAAGVVVIAAAELIAPWVGAVLGLIFIAIGAVQAIGWLRVGLGEPDEEPRSGTRGAEEPPA